MIYFNPAVGESYRMFVSESGALLFDTTIHPEYIALVTYYEGPGREQPIYDGNLRDCSDFGVL